MAHGLPSGFDTRPCTDGPALYLGEGVTALAWPASSGRARMDLCIGKSHPAEPGLRQGKRRVTPSVSSLSDMTQAYGQASTDEVMQMAKHERQDASETRWLSFRLRNGQSIGRAKLQAGWAAAAAVPGITVKREDLDMGSPVYALYGPSSLSAPQAAEMRMRKFLMDEGYIFTMGTLGAR